MGGQLAQYQAGSRGAYQLEELLRTLQVLPAAGRLPNAGAMDAATAQV